MLLFWDNPGLNAHETHKSPLMVSEIVWSKLYRCSQEKAYLPSSPSEEHDLYKVIMLLAFFS